MSSNHNYCFVFINGSLQNVCENRTYIQLMTCQANHNNTVILRRKMALSCHVTCGLKGYVSWMSGSVMRGCYEMGLTARINSDTLKPSTNQQQTAPVPTCDRRRLDSSIFLGMESALTSWELQSRGYRKCSLIYWQLNLRWLPSATLLACKWDGTRENNGNACFLSTFLTVFGDFATYWCHTRHQWLTSCRLFCVNPTRCWFQVRLR